MILKKTPVRSGFAKRLAAARLTAGYETARDFAAALGMKEGTYTRYERGETEPSYDFLVLMCDLAKTTPNFLLLGRY